MVITRDNNAIAMADNNCYLPYGVEEEDDDGDGNGGHRRSPPCDVLVSLSCGSPSSSLPSSSEESASGSTATPPAPPKKDHHRRRRRGGRAAFECRTCGREFATFQALGGHRTSHLRRPPMKLRPRPVVAHACGTCGLGFSTGQALGGHMRRHRMGRAVDDMDLTRIIMQENRPSSASSLQLLPLFV